MFDWRAVLGVLLWAMMLCLAPQAGWAGAEMTFQIVTIGRPAQCGSACPQAIAAEGEITGETPELFRNFVREHYQTANLHSIVLLDSYGGKVLASMELGKIFRQIGAAVIVAQPGGGLYTGGNCLSACVYALMGGKKRVVPPQSHVGVHRMVAYGSGYDSEFFGGPSRRRLDDGTVAAALAHYCAAMGVSPAVIALAEHTSPDGLHVLSRGEIAGYRLAVSKW